MSILEEQEECKSKKVTDKLIHKGEIFFKRRRRKKDKMEIRVLIATTY